MNLKFYLNIIHTLMNFLSSLNISKNIIYKKNHAWVNTKKEVALNKIYFLYNALQNPLRLIFNSKNKLDINELADIKI